MKQILALALLSVSLTACFGIGGSPAPVSSPVVTAPARTLISVDTLPNGGGVNCNWSDGTSSHHSDAAHCGQ